MGVQEDLRNMKNEGRSERDIIGSLRRQGLSDKSIADALAQSKIKEAVSAPSPENEILEQTPDTGNNIVQPLNEEEMYSPSQISSPANQEKTESYAGGASFGLEQNQEFSAPVEQQAPQPEEYAYSQAQESAYAPTQEVAGNYPVDSYSAEAYSRYQPYQEAMSSDMITEISEQIVSEKLSVLQDKLEGAINFRTVAESRIASISERLKRIEKIIDRLQLSLLQKVGEYVTDVKDLKQEVEETQKSFKALASKKTHAEHSHSQHSEHSHH